MKTKKNKVFRGIGNKVSKQLKYCIQKHKARNLHYDLRLEVKGVAKSWAIPKEPPRKDGIKRLAIKVANHSIDYMGFEGDITEGYGKGSVKIWDKGYWELESVKSNKIVGMIHGKKLKGRFTLIKFKDNWLFFKCK